MLKFPNRIIKATVLVLILGGLTMGLNACQKSGSNQNTNGQTNAVTQNLPPSPGLILSVQPAKGPVSGGTAVKIIGENFTGQPKVLFGETEAVQVTVKSATEMEVKTPAGKKGKVDVVLKNSAGTVSALQEGFLYE
ncbi:hypothetical protein C4546_00240 [Candidatus Parcubacteria bacterium]|jgi:hypothetical protein|nr:MAG: hypothetical protein C4546_00240 [Candidatus Parcubacteria bacterium]